MPKILIIDDEQPLRDEVSDWLEFEGYQVVSAENGRIGLAVAAHSVPDLIICNIAMPEMDGRTVLLEVRSDPTLSDIPFIFLTASATYESIRRGMNLGADDYLTKPFKRADLLHAIHSRLRKQAEQQQVMRSQLDAVSKAFKEEQERRLLKSRLVAMFSHDFRNPLLSILSSAEMLETFGNRLDDDRKRTYLQRIGGSVHLLLQMLDDMLTVAEIENGHLAFHPVAVDLAHFFAEIVDEFRMIYHKRHFVFEALFSATVQADPKLLRQISTNLLSNAVKYSPIGTTVTVRLQADNGGFALHVIDQGVGIPEKELANLFKAFYRMETTISQKGTGLGLAIVEKAVASCGGSVGVTSTVGSGSSFVVTFPHALHPGSA